VQTCALPILERKGISAERSLQIWGDMGEEYFLRESIQDIAWHTAAVADQQDNAPLILIKKTNNKELAGATQIFVRSKERKNVFVAVDRKSTRLNSSHVKIS